jgi:hypothetical protein
MVGRRAFSCRVKLYLRKRTLGEFGSLIIQATLRAVVAQSKRVAPRISYHTIFVLHDTPADYAEVHGRECNPQPSLGRLSE